MSLPWSANDCVTCQRSFIYLIWLQRCSISGLHSTVITKKGVSSQVVLLTQVVLMFIKSPKSFFVLITFSSSRSAWSFLLSQPSSTLWQGLPKICYMCSITVCHCVGQYELRVVSMVRILLVSGRRVWLGLAEKLNRSSHEMKNYLSTLNGINPFVIHAAEYGAHLRRKAKKARISMPLFSRSLHPSCKFKFSPLSWVTVLSFANTKFTFHYLFW